MHCGASCRITTPIDKMLGNESKIRGTSLNTSFFFFCFFLFFNFWWNLKVKQNQNQNIICINWDHLIFFIYLLKFTTNYSLWDGFKPKKLQKIRRTVLMKDSVYETFIIHFLRFTALSYLFFFKGLTFFTALYSSGPQNFNQTRGIFFYLYDICNLICRVNGVMRLNFALDITQVSDKNMKMAR